MHDDGNHAEGVVPRGFRGLKFRSPLFSAKKSENIKHFFSKFEKYIEFARVDAEDRIEALGLCLSDEGLEAYDSIKRNDEEIMYEELKERLVTRFDDERINLVIRAKIDKRKLKNGESVTDFFSELRKWADKIDLDDGALLYSFVSGLSPAMTQLVVGKNPQTALEAYSYAKTLHEIKTLHQPDEQKPSAVEALKKELQCGKVNATKTSTTEDLKSLKLQMEKIAGMLTGTSPQMDATLEWQTTQQSENWPNNNPDQHLGNNQHGHIWQRDNHNMQGFGPQDF